MPILNVIFFFVELVTVLVTGLYQESRKIEIMEESGFTKVCPYPWNYPISVRWAAGTSLPDNTITICGGSGEDEKGHHTKFTECHTLIDEQWKMVGNLEIERYEHALSTIGNNKGTYIWLALIIPPF